MFTCKQVSKALSEEDYSKLSFWRRLSLKLHVSFCFICGKFNRQVMVMQDTCREFKKQEEEGEPAPSAPMDEERKRKMREALEKEAS